MYQTVTGDLSPPDFLGSNTVSILENWLSVYQTEVEEASEMSGEWSLMQTDEGGIALLLDGEVLAVGQARVDEPNSNDEVYWNVQFDALGGGIGGWNRTTETDGVLSTIENGVQFYLDEYNGDQEFNDLVSKYAPPETVDLSGTFAEDFDFAGAVKIQYEIWNNDFDGDGIYNSYDRAKFIPDDGTGGTDWDNKVSVELISGQFILKDADYNQTEISWIDPNLALSTPNFLGSNTVSILENWLSVYQTEVEEASEMSGEWSLMQTDEGGIALLLNGGVLAVGQAHVDAPNSNGEVYWDVHFDALGGGIGGWNRTTDTDGVLSTTENGVKFYLDEYNGDQEFDDLVSKYEPPETVDLSGTFAENFDFAGAVKIHYEIWNNDFDGDGTYNSYDRAQFIPDDGTGGTDWDNKVQVELRDGVFEIKDANNSTIERYFTQLTEDPSVSYNDYPRHSEILDNLLGETNAFAGSQYELLNESLVSVDVNSDGLDDVYIQGAHFNSNWQPILDPQSLDRVGGLYQEPTFDFVRLPSDFTALKAWVAGLDFGTIENPDIAEVADAMLEELDSLMSRNYDAQLQFWKSSESPSKSVGIRFFDGEVHVGNIWINNELDAQPDNPLTPYNISIWSEAYSSTGLDNVLYTSQDVYTDNYNQLVDMISLASEELSASFDLNLTSEEAFLDFGDDIASVNDGIQEWATIPFVGALESLYNSQFVASGAVVQRDTEYLVEVASDDIYAHYLVFNSEVSILDVNNAILNPEENVETLLKLTGIESVDIPNESVVAVFGLDSGVVSISNLSGSVGAPITSVELSGGGFISPAVLEYAVQIAYQFATNNADDLNKTYGELSEDAFVEFGFDKLALKQDDLTLLTIQAQNQETQTSSVTLTFDDSVVTSSNGYSNISDVIHAMDDLNEFDPLSAVLIAAEQNAVENSVSTSVQNGDLTLLSFAVSDASVMADLDPSYLIVEENMTTTPEGYTFVDPNENIEFNIIVDPSIALDEISLILETDII